MWIMLPMAKSASPVRLQEDLMRSASLAGARQHRSAAQQIEYWAALGRAVADHLDPDRLLAVQAGLARLTVEPVTASPLVAEKVFTALEADRAGGALRDAVSSASVRYQASVACPGLLERIDADGQRSVGRFIHGVFQPCNPANL